MPAQGTATKIQEGNLLGNLRAAKLQQELAVETNCKMKLKTDQLTIVSASLEAMIFSICPKSKQLKP